MRLKKYYYFYYFYSAPRNRSGAGRPLSRPFNLIPTYGLCRSPNRSSWWGLPIVAVTIVQEELLIGRDISLAELLYRMYLSLHVVFVQHKAMRIIIILWAIKDIIWAVGRP